MPEITVYGAPWCPDCKRSKQFLSQHRVAFNWVDVDQDQDGLALVEGLQQGGRTIPTIVFGDGDFLLEPSDEELARKLGLSLKADRSFYDLAIVGGGPAGLAAAIYAAREGMGAIVIDRSALGGQSGVTERIDNYPGFPEGVGGADLAERFIAQARRYLVELLPAVSVAGVGLDGEDVLVRLGTGQELAAHAVILATGSSYRRLGVPGEDDLIGAGVHFCATCDGPFYKGANELMVIGGGNSALEEGLFLAQFGKLIRVLARSGLTASPVLQERVRSDPQFDIRTGVDIVELEGGRGRFAAVVARDRDSKEMLRFPAAAAFVFIGLKPNNAFLDAKVERDAGGFLITSPTMETSMAGVFVAGDVRSGSTKQLGSAVGDGIAALLMTRRYLETHHHKAVPL